MTGSKEKKEVSKLASDSIAIAKKIVIHSKSDPTGDKFLKYMHHVSTLKKDGGSYRCRSPWVELRTHGALSAVMEALKKVFVSDDMQNMMAYPSPALNEDDKIRHKAACKKLTTLCNVGLSILSNAFALDYSVRSEAIKNGFISSLQQFIASFTHRASVTFKNAEIISRAVKCTANLSNDSHCRESVLRTGVAISILRVLEMVDEEMTAVSFAYNPEPDPNEECLADKTEIRQLICSCVRGIRILTSDTKFMSCGRDHVLKFGGLVTIMNVLTWNAKLSCDEDIVLDVIKALTFLSLRIRSAPADIIHQLVYNAESCKMRNLVKIFQNSQPDGKLYLPVINCLIKFSSNKELSDCLGGLRIFPILLEKLDTTTEDHYHDLIKLLMALTKYSSFNQNHLTTSPLIGSTIKILKSSSFKEYHGWLLRVYENLYEVSLTKLVKCDLVSHLCAILRQELEACDYDCLRKKISSLDDGSCSVHKSQGSCPFIPLYRCNSPSYQKIQEEMKSKMTLDDEQMDFSQLKKGEDSLSPLSSPAHSWSSDDGYSPMLSEVSCASYSTSFSDDEKSLVTRDFSCESPEVSPLSDQELSHDSEYSEGPIRKKQRLEEDVIKEREISQEALKNSAKKIAGVLNILYKCTYVQPFPEVMLQIVPLLLGIILRGKISQMPQRSEYESLPPDTELHDLSRRAFEVSYKILLRMCSIIQIFPEMIVTGMIPVLHRLQEPAESSSSDRKISVVQQYCANIISRMVGLENDTAGWREGFIMRAILVNDTSIPREKIDQMILNIPLLYQKHSHLLRKFEMKAKSWTKILDMLINSDDSSFYSFEDCALALCTICSAIGVKWKPFNVSRKLPLLFQHLSSTNMEGVVDFLSNGCENDVDMKLPPDDKVRLVLDDGTIFHVKKELLVKASPVFSAMFDGNFIEAGQRSVSLPNVSKMAVSIMLYQTFMLSKESQNNTSSKHCDYDLLTIFELISLADRFLLSEITQRALNTIVTEYICPFSVPLIYAESVKLTSLAKLDNTSIMLGDNTLNLCILKFVLTAQDITMSERCTAIRKIFDTVEPEHVVKDLKSVIEHHMYKS